jgi:TM2 domain-containing membrane protein YozV
MEQSKVDMYLVSNGKFFETAQIPAVRDLLLNADDSKWAYIQALDLKDPTMMLIVSLLGGTLGIDRFMIGDTGMGIGKLLTCGGAGIWAIVDLFLIMDAARQKNLAQLSRALA